MNQANNTQTHYLDIKVIPQAEISSNIILSKAFGLLHPYMVEYNHFLSDKQLSIGFPKYSDNSVGEILRVFGDKLQLEKLISTFNILNSYIEDLEVKITPKNITDYEYFYRERYISNSQINRNIARKNRKNEIYSDEEMKDMIKKYSSKKKAPFLVINSKSTQQEKIRIYIGSKKSSKGNYGILSSFGLNQKKNLDLSFSTVPIF
ncbi:MAG: type I-F CRISPR-associated endoribonuclease Cas6/Csy4 [Psittacicella sp.]